jgi:branched-chain amino acid transport system substrate-binding protein
VGAKSMALVVCAEVAACAESESLVKPVAARLGIRFDGLLTVSSTAPDYTPQCLELKQKNTQLIFALINAAALGRLVQNCAQQGYNPMYGVAGTTLYGGLAQVTDGNVVAAMEGFPWWVNDPVVKQFRDVMNEYGAGQDYQYPAATQTWAALQLFRMAMSEAPATPNSAAEVAQAMYHLKPTNLDGLLPVTVSYQKSAPTAKVAKWCVYVVEMKNRQFEAPNGLKPTCPASSS